MAHFAQLDTDNKVIQVIVAELADVESGLFGDPSSWLQTSYNTMKGTHPEDKPFRKNFAGIGYTYDPVRDAFIAPKPFESWVLDEQTCLWEAPLKFPEDGKLYLWDEENQKWNEVK